MTVPVERLSHNPFAVLNGHIAQLRADGADVIRLDIGSPDLPTAHHIIQALAESATNPGHHGYQSHRGTVELRQAWASTYQRLYDLNLDPENILPLLGSKEGIFHLSQAILEPRDIVLVPDPGYQTYTQSARFAGAEPFAFPLTPENNYLPDLSSIPPAIAKRAAILWLNYPNNPTGAIAPMEFFAEAVDFCRRNRILLCHDAAYTRIGFDGYQPPSVLQVPGAQEVAIEFNTLSKSHNMAGWRLGAAIGSPMDLLALLKLKTHADSGHFRPALDAAVAALNGDQDWLIDRNDIYRKRRDIVLSALAGIGLDCRTPQAAMYVWSPVPSGWTSAKFVTTLLEHAHVSLAPGTVFGERGEGCIRISLVQPVDRLTDAMQRLRNFVQNATPIPGV